MSRREVTKKRSARFPIRSLRSRSYFHRDEARQEIPRERIVYTAIDRSREVLIRSIAQVLNKRWKSQAALEVKSRRVGGATYQVPMEVAPGVKSHCHALICQYADNAENAHATRWRMRSKMPLPPGQRD